MNSLMMDLTLAVESLCRENGFDRTAMAIVAEAFGLCSSLGRHAVAVGY